MQDESEQAEHSEQGYVDDELVRRTDEYHRAEAVQQFGRTGSWNGKGGEWFTRAKLANVGVEFRISSSVEAAQRLATSTLSDPVPSSLVRCRRTTCGAIPF